jgi:hypothetical protein
MSSERSVPCSDGYADYGGGISPQFQFLRISIFIRTAFCDTQVFIKSSLKGNDVTVFVYKTQVLLAAAAAFSLLAVTDAWAIHKKGTGAMGADECSVDGCGKPKANEGYGVDKRPKKVKKSNAGA